MKFLYFRSIYVFWVIFPFLLPPIMTMMHLCIMLYTLGLLDAFAFEWARTRTRCVSSRAGQSIGYRYILNTSV